MRVFIVIMTLMLSFCGLTAEKCPEGYYCRSVDGKSVLEYLDDSGRLNACSDSNGEFKGLICFDVERLPEVPVEYILALAEEAKRWEWGTEYLKQAIAETKVVYKYTMKIRSEAYYRITLGMDWEYIFGSPYPIILKSNEIAVTPQTVIEVSFLSPGAPRQHVGNMSKMAINPPEEVWYEEEPTVSGVTMILPEHKEFYLGRVTRKSLVEDPYSKYP